jgi:hypothetical protein
LHQTYSSSATCTDALMNLGSDYRVQIYSGICLIGKQRCTLLVIVRQRVCVLSSV